MERNGRPNFWSSFFKALSKRADDGELLSFFIPFLTCPLIATSLVYFIPDSFWSDTNLEISVTVYGAILAFNGLLMALCWSAFSRVYDIILHPKISTILLKHNILNDYIITVEFAHWSQVLASFTTFVGTITVLYSDIFSFFYDRCIFIAASSLTLYAIYQATHIVSVMHDLVWHKSELELNSSDDNDEKIVEIPNKNGKR